MSRITISGNASGTATFTVASPATNTDRTLTLPDVTGTLGLNPVPSAALGSVIAGELEYDGTAGYFCPTATQRGVLTAAQLFRLNAGRAGTNATGAQSVFGVGVSLTASTVYEFEAEYVFSKSAGTTSHTMSLLFGGTATLNNIMFRFTGFGAASAATTSLAGNSHIGYFTAAAGGVASVAITTAAAGLWYTIRGTVSVNAAGTFIPQYSLSAAPGGAYTTVAGSYFAIWPIGASGANTSVGTWA